MHAHANTHTHTHTHTGRHSKVKSKKFSLSHYTGQAAGDILISRPSTNT